MNVRLITIGVLAAALAACGGDMSDLRNYIAEVKGREGEPIEPLPSIQPPPTFEYAAYDLRDPFTGGPIEDLIAGPAVAETAEGIEGPKPDFNRRREVLENFELDSLEMVGTFFIDQQLFGLIEDPDGLIHRIREDNYLGRNYGRVIAVFDDRVQLVELVPNGAGAWMERRAEIALDEE
ncbi:MAG: pilus assembly protein PilP [Xanthomonadales bacterium]|nr:pilus assembly protein PilP [Xanthomonadales bacterium]